MPYEMPEQEHHTMELVQTHKSGADELYCPTCGRRILLQWPPNYKKVVLVEGNDRAIHSGSTGGLELNAPQLTKTVDSPFTRQEPEAEQDDFSKDITLAPFINWMDRVGFDTFWD
jgi:hypothetical protein